MKTKLLLFALITLLVTAYSTAQDRTTIYAKDGEISDNLDLKAVASVFGESSNLQDFERRLNDPRLQLSNLDLNYDNQVDYLRVIESVENRTHVIIIQAVLGRDMFQDVATIDVEKDRYNTISIQVVGDVFMYGPNYIYEPVYYRTPAIYASFWIGNYRPYYSRWNWNYYPTYYYTWNPFPVYRYRRNINHCINAHNSYRYVSYRSSYRAPQIYASKRNNAFERRYPDYSFSRRNNDVVNHYELERSRDNRDVYSDNKNGTRNQANTDRNYSASRRYADNNNYSRDNTIQHRNENIARTETAVRKETKRNYIENSEYNRRASTKRNEVENNFENRRSQSSREYSAQKTTAPSENRNSETYKDVSRNEKKSYGKREYKGENRRI